MNLSTILLPLVVGTFSIGAADWSQWRGPSYNGSSPEKNLPSQWSKTDNIAWSVDLPGPSAATPIISGDNVFISSAESRTKTLRAICIDRKTGAMRWDREAGIGYGRDNKSTFASPSPVTDGKRAIFFYGNGDMAAFDLKGEKRWSRNLQMDYGDFAFQWTFSATPLLWEGKLYQEVLQRDVPMGGRARTDGPIESFLLAMDPASGKTLWRHVRPSDAVAESREAYSTPLPFEFKGRKEIVIAGGDCLTGHDPATGKELWRWATWNPQKIGHWRLVPSPVAGVGVILACAPKGDPIYAIKAGGSGVLDDSWIAWKSERGAVSSDVPTPAFYDGDFFVLNESRRALSRVEPQTGKIKWTVATPGRVKFEASPTAVDGKIYCMNFAAEVVVFDATNGQVISTIGMGEPGDDNTRSSISVAQSQLFIRTNGKLYCVGKKAATTAKN